MPIGSSIRTLSRLSNNRQVFLYPWYEISSSRLHHQSFVFMPKEVECDCVQMYQGPGHHVQMPDGVGKGQSPVQLEEDHARQVGGPAQTQLVHAGRVLHLENSKSFSNNSYFSWEDCCFIFSFLIWNYAPESKMYQEIAYFCCKTISINKKMHCPKFQIKTNPSFF